MTVQSTTQTPAWLEDLLAGLDSVELPALVAAADLQQRFDTKYLLDIGRLPALVAALGDGFRVLEVDGRRSTSYTSVYFDTADLRTYHDHLQDRRRRFKIRTRHYGEPAGAMLEVKCKDPQGQTLKHRWPHPGPAPDQLGAEAYELIGQALWAEYRLPVPEGLHAVATTRFERVTLADLGASERITIDLDLSIDVKGQELHFDSDHAVLEVKAGAPRSRGTRALASLRVEPEHLSKYGAGIAAARGETRSNPWLSMLQSLEDDIAAETG